jgi:hypothetical protein
VNVVPVGGKHFFGHKQTPSCENLPQRISDTKNVLFVCLVRNPVDWLNSLYREPHHLTPKLNKAVDRLIVFTTKKSLWNT